MPNFDTLELVINVPASRLWKATFDIHNLGPKILPEVFLSSRFIKGDGAPGSIKEVHLQNPVTGETVAHQEVLDFVDEATYTIKYHMDGDVKKRYSVYNVVSVLVPGPDSCSTTIKYTVETEAVAGVQIVEAEYRKPFYAFTKALEAYLLAHETEYA